jgi:hypothetical protein
MSVRGCSCSPSSPLCLVCQNLLMRATGQDPHGQMKEKKGRGRAAGPGEEAILQRQLRSLARAHGWLYYHTHDSRLSDAGFPDTVLCRMATGEIPGRLVFAELKSEAGKMTQDQQLWLEVLAHSVPGIESVLWRPSDWGAMVATLANRA